MSNNLYTFDLGNSNPNFGFFKDNKLINSLPISEWIGTSDNFKAVISRVGAPLPSNIQESISNDLIELPTLKNGMFLDMSVNYEDGLGVDRLYLAYYVYKNILINGPILLIDSGTFTTIDLIDKNGFQGGYIFPGVEQYLKVYKSGHDLPEVELKGFTLKNLQEIPHSTNSAISSSFSLQTGAVLDFLINKYSPEQIIITGGKKDIFKELIKTVRPNSELSTMKDLLHHSLSFLVKLLIVSL